MGNNGGWRSGAPLVKGYSEAGASYTRRALKGFRPNSGSPNEDIQWNNATLRQRARMLYMSAPVATAAINTNRTNVIGSGLSLQATVDRDVLGISKEAAEAWQQRTEKEFQMWAGNARNCDALGLNTFDSLQQLVIKSALVSGDCFVLLKRVPSTKMSPYSMRLHVIEADRISTPTWCRNAVLRNGITDGVVPEQKPGAGHRIYDGVEVDETGCAVAYYVCNVYPNQITSEEPEWTRVERFGSKSGCPNILPIMEAERPDQYRGVSYLAQVIEPLLQMRRYTESEIMAAMVQSYFTAWITTETDTSEIPFNEVGTGDIGDIGADPAGDNISSSENEYEMSSGMVFHLTPGEDVKFGNPNIPTAGFETFMKTFCRLVGAALELPYDVLIKEFNSSYSASRGALLEAWKGFKMRRVWIVNSLCKPVYETWLAEAVARGRINAPGFFDDPLIREAWCGTQWIGPTQGQLDPKKEAEAALMLTNCGIKTHEQVTRELCGGDWRANVEQLRVENELLKAAGSPEHTVVIPTGKDDDEGDGDGGEDD